MFTGDSLKAEQEVTKVMSLHRKFLSLALLPTLAFSAVAPLAHAEASEGLTITWVETSTPQDGSYRPGDVVTWDVTVRNDTDAPRAVKPTASSTTGWEACRWSRINPGQTKTDCHNFISHVVTEEDAHAGSFTPRITYQMMESAAYTAPVAWEHEVVGEAVEASPAWPTAEPAPLPDVSTEAGASLRLSSVSALATNNEPQGSFYRIPALTTAPNGDLLASYDLRPGSTTDAPNPNSIMQRRSRDNGRTWDPPTVVHAGRPGAQKVGYSDPSYIVDPATGKIFNFHVKSYDRGFAQSQAGTDPDDRNVLHVEVSTSTDNGHTWSHRIITGDITPDPTTRTRFVASGQGTVLQYGPHAGRLVAQMTVRNSAGQQAQTIYSDDHGDTWKAGQPVGQMMDENKVVELSDGTLMLNSRDAVRSGFRKKAFSHDGGQTWGDVTLDDDLIDPTNNAQIIRAFPNAEEGSDRAKILLFTNSRDARSRINGTLSVSCDDGQSWASKQTYMPGEVGYTTVAVQSDGSVGLLWERNGIHYANTTMAWLPSVCPAAADESAPSEEETPTPTPSASVPTESATPTPSASSDTPTSSASSSATATPTVADSPVPTTVQPTEGSSTIPSPSQSATPHEQPSAIPSGSVSSLRPSENVPVVDSGVPWHHDADGGSDAGSLHDHPRALPRTGA